MLLRLFDSQRALRLIVTNHGVYSRRAGARSFFLAARVTNDRSIEKAVYRNFPARVPFIFVSFSTFSQGYLVVCFRGCVYDALCCVLIYKELWTRDVKGLECEALHEFRIQHKSMIDQSARRQSSTTVDATQHNSTLKSSVQIQSYWFINIECEPIGRVNESSFRSEKGPLCISMRSVCTEHL